MVSKSPIPPGSIIAALLRLVFDTPLRETALSGMSTCSFSWTVTGNLAYKSQRINSNNKK